MVKCTCNQRQGACVRGTGDCMPDTTTSLFLKSIVDKWNKIPEARFLEYFSATSFLYHSTCPPPSYLEVFLLQYNIKISKCYPLSDFYVLELIT